MGNMVGAIIDKEEQEGRCYYMCGDLNAWYGERCGKRTCRTGRVIEDLMRRYDLVNLLDRDEITFMRGD